MLVDDQPEFQRMAKKLLERDGGLDVTAVGSAEEALELLNKKTFDVIISDYEMQGMDGIELLETLRAQGNDVPVIIYASQGKENAIIRAVRSGAELFLQKSADPRSQLTELRFIVEEIAKRKRTESALRRRENDFHVIVERNADAMLVLDNRGSIRYANPAANILFNMKESELIGKVLGFPIILQDPVEMYIVRGYQEFVAAEMRMVEVVWEEEPSYLISFRDVTGHVQYEEELEERVHERTAKLENTNRQLLNEIESRVAAEEELRADIEERRTAEEELRREIEQREAVEKALIETKSQAELYLDLMGHDINNLNQIGIGYLELAMELSDVDEIKTLIEKPLEAMKSASEIIDNVRKLKQATIEHSESANATKIININDILPEIIKRYAQVTGRNITINVQSPKICPVKANDLIKDVFSNLVGNSVKHSDPIRPLMIDINIKRIKEKGKEYFLCTVEDNGPGIPDWVKDRVFQRFEKGATKAKGSGLGLYLVKKLVDGYNGVIWVEDRIPGVYNQGAKFIFTLPVAEM
ncbi:MAG TPA: response regulator [Methanocella sp.]|uniref:response regulator n=1 Tax=Methanocella sp. TaxID=2052833 RepID=UPI002C3B91F6|nr:response regulator [Methanocella sp.]HTY91220.1 response regulator [Methanocella sp.]